MTSIRSLSSGLITASFLLLATGCGDRDEAATDQTTVQSESAAAAPDASKAIETSDQIVSYGIGHNMGANILRQGGLEVDQDAFLAGFQDGLAGNDPSIADEKLQAAFMEVQGRAEAAAAQYLAANKAKPGVVTTESGLQYKVLESGSGPKPGADDTVEVHYHGTLMNGKVFDSSVERGETVSFPVSGVIPGWVEALQLMSVGDKWQLTIPPELGYGDRAAGAIPPGSVLNFEVELISIK